MSKLPLSAQNVRHVASTLARAAGAQERVSLSDVMDLVEGPIGELATHFATWMTEGVASVPVSGTRTPAAAIVPDRGRPIVDRPVEVGNGIRRADQGELKRVMHAGFDRAEPEPPRSLVRLWNERLSRVRGPRRSAKPAGYRRKVKRRPDTPRSVRAARAMARLEAVRAAAELPDRKAVRRYPDKDWKGARNELVAGYAAWVLRAAGHPMMPSELCRRIVACGGPHIRKPGRDLPPSLVGSRMGRVAGTTRGLLWFVDETVPARPNIYQRRDTAVAHVRELAAATFAKALEIMKSHGPAGISIKSLTAKLGAETLAPFNRDWLTQKLKRSAKDAGSTVKKVKGGFACAPIRTKTAVTTK